ncbi:hypothetical protein [Nocardia xishanensis]|uniref:hypothetical protein n=1 Tax=Nocardia xishanensis TaxID=238964 RepID=UPI000AAB5D0F|nr:hypothetical protein [Nocardia xishanensis]
MTDRRDQEPQPSLPVDDGQPIIRSRRGSRTKSAAFIRHEISSEAYHPDGSVEIETSPAVWTLAHEGYSGGGRLDVWVYPDRNTALHDGAQLALECGLDEDPANVRLFKRKKYAEILERYEQERPDHILRVQASLFVYGD